MIEPTLWQFWIDVGGTFTDCLALTPTGEERYDKVLSSGIVKGNGWLQIEDTGSPTELMLVDAGRQEPCDFWNTATCKWFDGSGRLIGVAKVEQYRRSRRDAAEIPAVISAQLAEQSTNNDSIGLFRLKWEPGLSLSDPRQSQDDDTLSGRKQVTLTEPSLALARNAQREVRYELDPDLPAPVLAIHLLQQLPIHQPLPPCHVDLGTTRGTNALLTRTGARTALVTSHGFRDLLLIGDQTRPDLFALNVDKGVPLFEQSIEIEERVLVDGTVLKSPDPGRLRQQLQRLKEEGIESLAVCLMFSYRYPEHEQWVGRVAHEIGFRSIRLSSDVAPLIKIIPRAETTVLDAYLDPVIADYLNRVENGLGKQSRLRLMTSAGGLVARHRFSGKDSVLSGPAGGVVGAAGVGRQCGFPRVIGFDMGGTSTDVSRFDGDFVRSFETRKSGVRIMTPMMDIETVAAGGGSICWFDGTRLRVGPQSAGADPGPACYGRGGPLAVTDINLFLERLDTDLFPFRLDHDAVARQLTEMVDVLTTAGFALNPRQIAEGFLEIANQNMASAIATVSVAQGVDPGDYALVSFGGAGSQHCCGVANKLGIKKIIDHPHASILSAVGIRLAEQAAHAVEAIEFELPEFDPAGSIPIDSLSDFDCKLRTEIFPRLLGKSLSDLQSDGELTGDVNISNQLDIRFRGSETTFNVLFDRFEITLRSISSTSSAPAWSRPSSTLKPRSLADSLTDFFRLHQRQFGYLPRLSLEIQAARVEVRIPESYLPAINIPNSTDDCSTKSTSPVEAKSKFDSVGEAKLPNIVPRWQRSNLAIGSLIEGPAIVADRNSTTVIDVGWRGQVFDRHLILLEPVESDLPRSDSPDLPTSTLSCDQPRFHSFACRGPKSAAMKNKITQVKETVLEEVPLDPVKLEIFNNHFAMIARQMGNILQKTSISVNVKERLDFSCAIFTKVGDLVVNAPHIPVHLGAMSETIRAVIAENKLVFPGDVFVTNDPYAGGSHLPDVTVVTPVFAPVATPSIPASGLGQIPSELMFWVASRSHHAEIGGMTPGSMPANATELGQEGVLIQNFQLIRGVRRHDPNEQPTENFAQLWRLLTESPYPSRSPQENIADIRAQMAANQAGARLLVDLVQRYSLAVVAAYMQFIQQAAAQKARKALADLPDGDYSFADSMDNGATIRVRLSKQHDQLKIDFHGTDGVLPDNLNANRAIVSAAVMYVMRLLIDQEIPLNEGIMHPVTLVLPEDCFLNPRPSNNRSQSPAIVGGNVETSQRIVDCLLGGLQVAAASQGTMNNWLMGNENFGYYETIGGGSGATAVSDGADAVHTHMTNTRLTDPETLEFRYPVILKIQAVRTGSGGSGKRRGGEGILREVEFTAPMQVTLLTSRRNRQPFGLAGGQSGAAGRNLLLTGDQQIELPSRCQLNLAKGDRLRIETPGGGGWGTAGKPD